MTTSKKFDVIDYQEIPIESIFPHEDNPRPLFHLEEDDPNLVSLGDAIKIDGQHNPATVYEMVGGWREEDSPGHYRIYQGERRWRACKAVGVPTLRCIVVRAPEDYTEELEWLGNEEAHKQSWQQFFQLRHCQDLADQLGIDIATREMATKTGVPLGDLKMAKKVFKLQPEIQGLVVAYEQAMYQAEAEGRRKSGGRLRGAGIPELPVNKAAAIYDLFDAFRSYVPNVCRHMSDLDLQTLIVRRTSKNGRIKDLTDLASQIKQINSDNPPEKLMGKILDYLDEDNKKGQRDFAKETGARERASIQQAEKAICQARKRVGRIMSMDQDVFSYAPEESKSTYLELIELRSELADMADRMREYVR